MAKSDPYRHPLTRQHAALDLFSNRLLFAYFKLGDGGAVIFCLIFHLMFFVFVWSNIGNTRMNGKDKTVY